MTDETSNIAVLTEAAIPAKKLYVRPQLHLLSGDGAEGKVVIGSEIGDYGPS